MVSYSKRGAYKTEYIPEGTPTHICIDCGKKTANWRRCPTCHWVFCHGKEGRMDEYYVYCENVEVH